MDGWAGEELTSSELLACVVVEHPAFRSGAELDRIDPDALSAGEQIDLLAVLEDQRRWFEAVQLRVLASIKRKDDSRLGLGQEGVSLALQVPLRSAQTRLAQADTLVRDLPRTLAAVADGRSPPRTRTCWPRRSGSCRPIRPCRPRSSRRCCRRCWPRHV
jgi:hypothetical protein